MAHMQTNRSNAQANTVEHNSDLTGLKAEAAAPGMSLPSMRSLELAEQGLADVRRFVEGARKSLFSVDSGQPQFAVDPHQQASREIRKRDTRNALLGDDLFSDPAWDILLLLFSELPRREYLMMKDFALKARVPLTTALRWVSALENRGLVWRRGDSHDKRAANVGLTTRGKDLLVRYFAD